MTALTGFRVLRTGLVPLLWGVSLLLAACGQTQTSAAGVSGTLRLGYRPINRLLAQAGKPPVEGL